MKRDRAGMLIAVSGIVAISEPEIPPFGCARRLRTSPAIREADPLPLLTAASGSEPWTICFRGLPRIQMKQDGMCGSSMKPGGTLTGTVRATFPPAFALDDRDIDSPSSASI
jgi:hypothetical protein